MMRLFVTGGTGFVGSHFVKAALDVGHSILALKRRNSAPRITLQREPSWLVAELDQVNEEHLTDHDVFVHFAAHSTNVPYDNLEQCLYWNLMVPLKLFRKAFNAGIKQFLVAGSCFEYGISGERFDFIPPDAPLEPTMTYPASKAASSIAFSQFAIEYKLKLQYLRIFQVYGEGENENRFWPSLYRAAMAGEDFQMSAGEQVRDFTPVGFVAQDFVEAIDFSDIEPGVPKIRNVGTGKPQTLKEFAEYWWDKWGAVGKLKFGEKPYRMNEVMRFVPRI